MKPKVRKALAGIGVTLVVLGGVVYVRFTARMKVVDREFQAHCKVGDTFTGCTQALREIQFLKGNPTSAEPRFSMKWNDLDPGFYQTNIARIRLDVEAGKIVKSDLIFVGLY